MSLVQKKKISYCDFGEQAEIPFEVANSNYINVKELNFFPKQILISQNLIPILAIDLIKLLKLNLLATLNVKI